VPVNVGEIQILVELLGILASLHLSSLLDSGVFELLESVLGKRWNLCDLSPSQPLGPLWAACTGEKSEKAHILTSCPESLIIWLRVVSLLLRIYIRELNLYHSAYFVRLRAIRILWCRWDWLGWGLTLRIILNHSSVVVVDLGMLWLLVILVH
jgi:hypothetical protein